ncbi:hypothetical protein JF66_12910 [Cryobacterium sp. MLB-32]|nr:hypothetical protein JF66_12910 [Cryobacterium sp. MLB-32]
MKASSPRWAVIAPGAVFGAAMVGLTTYRILRASGDDPVKAVVFLGGLIGAVAWANRAAHGKKRVREAAVAGFGALATMSGSLGSVTTLGGAYQRWT